jgi:hypothetical protein
MVFLQNFFDEPKSPPPTCEGVALTSALGLARITSADGDLSSDTTAGVNGPSGMVEWSASPLAPSPRAQRLGFDTSRASGTPLMQLRWTEAAANDLEHISNYLFEQAPDRARAPCRFADLVTAPRKRANSKGAGKNAGTLALHTTERARGQIS